MENKKLLCALVIGHKKSSPGAYNSEYNIHEFKFNDGVAIEIERQLKSNLIDIQKIYRRTYNSLPSDINELNPDFIISLHCNAFNKKASGCEVLYYHKSTKGKEIAKILQKHLLNVKDINKKDRGIIPITSEGRGGYLLKNTKAPCVIAEPFFIDNSSELQYFLTRRQKLITAYIDAIIEIAKYIRNT